MRWAFVSDIHGNLPAWNTVLADCAVRRVDRIVCLGDVVGYGPQPAECMRSVWERCHAMVLGNHDAVAAGLLSTDVFNDRAARSARWTRSRLSQRAAAAFSSLPLSLRGPGWRAAHGGLADPAAFDYVFTEDDAAATLAAASEQLLLCGHTHEAALFVVGQSGRVHKTAPQDFVLEDGKRYVVNAGSVGSPRDGDPRASYVVWDDEARSVVFVRVPFDFAAFRQAVAAAPGLDPSDVPLLRAAAVASAPDAVREAPDFSPGGARVEGAAEVADATAALLRDNARLRGRFRAALCTVALALALAGASALALVRARPHDGHFPESNFPPVSLGQPGSADGNLLPPFNPSHGDRFLCEPYRADLADVRAQSVSADDAWHVLFESADSSLEARLAAPSVEVRPGMRVEAMARARLSRDFSGSFQLVAVLERADGTEKELFRRDFSASSTGISGADMPSAIRALRRADGWLLARGTTDPLPEDAAFVRVETRGAFRGSATVGAMSARRRK